MSQKYKNEDVQYRDLLVLLQGDEGDPKVYDPDGVDVTEHCQSITIQPGCIAEAVMLSLDSKGQHYINTTKDTVATYTTNVVNITGTWITSKLDLTAQDLPHAIREEI